MTKQVELLTKLKEYVISDDFIPMRYVTEKNGQDCYCSVGFLLKELGCSKSALLELEDLKIIYVRARIANLDDSYYVMYNLFTVDEIEGIQALNDCVRDAINTRKLIDYIDELIVKYTK